MVAVAHFGLVNGEEAVGDIFDLFKGLVLAAHLKQIAPIDEEVALMGSVHFVADAQLVLEERLTHVADIYLAAQSMHQVGIVEEDLLGFIEVLVAFGFLREQRQDLGLIQGIQHTQA